MKIWLVNPFDPLPGEEEQLGRYADLAGHLRRAGHEVVWWSSDFSHRFKRRVDPQLVQQGMRDWGIHVELVPTPSYQRNVGARRLWSHRVYGRRFRRRAAEAPAPDLIFASSPPLESARESGRLGQRWSIPVVIDIQDQWPDNFVRVMPRLLRPIQKLLLKPLYKLEREAYQLADGIVGVAEGYVERGLTVGGPKTFHGVFPLGVNLNELRQAVEAGAQHYAEKWRKPEGQVWLLYSGSLSHNYDFQTIIQAAIPTKQRFADRVRFILTGTGELADEARRIIRDRGLDNVAMTGFLEFPEWAYLLSQADAGFNASFPDALIYLPNKIFYYLAAGAAVLNTIPGQCARLVEEHHCGFNYQAGDAQSCFDAICRLLDSPERLAEMGAAARRLAEQVFDRTIVYADLARFLEHVAAKRGG
jgi:glycosyltransferase involved in cell wall biosynthesis